VKNAPAKCFYGAFLSFAFHAKPVLASSTISYSFGCQDSPVKDFGGPSGSIKMAGSHTVTFASPGLLRNPYVAKFDDPMTDGCQGKKDFLA